MAPIHFVAYLSIILLVVAGSLLVERTRSLECGEHTITKRLFGLSRSVDFTRVSSATLRVDAFGEPSIVIKVKNSRFPFIVPIEDCRSHGIVDDVRKWLERATHNGASIHTNVMSLDLNTDSHRSGVLFPGSL